VAFPGFNRLLLKGTVLEAQGSSFFAVMIPDAGALDRDWHGLKLHGHGGRSLAEWLASQGIGSLRYDKRLVNTRDPSLDTSLDAQAGDLKAAVASLGTLPEARGKKRLLVGHGEGALLALVASAGAGADALLLLAMPPQTLARTITAQISTQLPAEIAAPNLAYLDSTFQAIREGRPVPKPGPDVHPNLARFCVSLMAPETLDFVRSTLDLDPWTMAARVAVPMAAVWGDRDVQAHKPAVAPSSFPGVILGVPGANHLFKLETRTRSQMDAASALSGYGDDTPLANLDPIAGWLKAINGKEASPASR
jgi:hypothetical protein